MMHNWGIGAWLSLGGGGIAGVPLDSHEHYVSFHALLRRYFVDSDPNSLWTFAKRWQLSSAQLSEFKTFTQEQDYSHLGVFVGTKTKYVFFGGLGKHHRNGIDRVAKGHF